VQEIRPTLGQGAVFVDKLNSIWPLRFEHGYEVSSDRLPHGLRHITVQREVNNRIALSGQGQFEAFS
jgi:hypothetical protein